MPSDGRGAGLPGGHVAPGLPARGEGYGYAYVVVHFAGIANYWRVEDEDGSPAVHAYELDRPTRSYVATGIHRHELRTTKPFRIKLDLDKLVPGRCDRLQPDGPNPMAAQLDHVVDIGRQDHHRRG